MNVLKKPVKLLGLLMTLTLPNCAGSVQQIQTTEAACRDWKPVTYSSCVADTCTADDALNIYDSEETVRQIERLNLYMGALCRAE